MYPQNEGHVELIWAQVAVSLRHESGSRLHVSITGGRTFFTEEESDV